MTPWRGCLVAVAPGESRRWLWGASTRSPTSKAIVVGSCRIAAPGVRLTSPRDESGNRRLSERREVLAREPPDRVPGGRRARAGGGDARPQGARDRLERPPADADRHRRRRP